MAANLEGKAAAGGPGQFVSVVSHELRLPMTSIRGYADLLLSGQVGPLTERQADFLDRIRRNVDRMAALVRDLSDLDRLERGRLALPPAAFELREALEPALQELQATFSERNQRFTLEIEAGLRPLYAHRPTVQQVLGQLLRNASLYTPPAGQVWLQAAAAGDRVEIEVGDNGIGISQTDQAHLFSPFFRSEDARVRQEAGWGLGLALTKGLLAAQGGTIAIASGPDEGTAVTVSLPAAAGQEASK
ncbi:MAG: sensor histidine kinase [Candidatus Promineifilaceae bacterium]